MHSVAVQSIHIILKELVCDLRYHMRHCADVLLGGGHAPDIIKVCQYDNVLPSSTSPTRPFAINTIDEHLDVSRDHTRVTYKAADNLFIRCSWSATTSTGTSARTSALQNLGFGRKQSRPKTSSKNGCDFDDQFGLAGDGTGRRGRSKVVEDGKQAQVDARSARGARGTPKGVTTVA